MRFKALRHQPSDAARKSGYDNEGQLPDTLPDSRSRPEADADPKAPKDRSTYALPVRLNQQTVHRPRFSRYAETGPDAS